MAAPVLAQPLEPPSSEYSPDDPSELPPSISGESVRIGGTYAYTWSQPDGTSVVQVEGDFTLKMGEYALRSKDAVVWMRGRNWQAKSYQEVDVFLWQDAEVRQPGGTVETGPALLVTMNTTGRLALDVGGHVRRNLEDSGLYQRGLDVRKAVAAASGAGGMTTTGATSTSAAPSTTSPPSAPSKGGTTELQDAGGPSSVAGATSEPTGTTAEGPVQLRTPGAATRIGLQPRRAPRRIDYSGRDLTSEVIEGRRVIVVIGEVQITQSEGRSADATELKADAAVLYLSEKATADLLGATGEKQTREVKPEIVSGPPDAAAEEKLTGKQKDARQSAREYVTAAYLEGDVVLTRGTRMIRAEKIYYDFENDKALLLDVVMRAIPSSRDVPVYVRAEQVRQLSQSEYAAKRARLTTSEFYTPHVAIGSTSAYLTDRTPRNERGEIIGVEAGTYKAYNTTLEVEGVPVAYWPFSRGDFSRDTQALKNVRVGYRSDFGATFETRWYLFNLLGMDPPPGYDATLRLDYFTDRGPGVGIDVDYLRENYYGLLRSYFIHDNGDDDLGPIRGGDPDTDSRGRLLWRHRQYLPQDWQLTLEAAYISDDNFLEAFERNEFENSKEQETAIYLLKRRDNWQFSALFNWRVMDFLTQTEHYPDLVFSLIGEPITDFATFYHESRAGLTRYKPDDRRLFDSDADRYDNTGRTNTVARGDTRDELAFVLPELGPVKLSPYLAGRASAWDDTPDNGGGQGRLFGSAGVRGNMYMNRVYDNVESDLLDVHRLRHIIKPEVTAWLSGSNLNSTDLYPFDSGVETIDDFGGVALGLRQIFETKRGGPGRWQTVDLITWDVEAGFFNNARRGDKSHGDFIYSRPEDSISSNFITNNVTYRISESTAIVSETTWDLDDGRNGYTGISLNVERDPRLAYFVGYRYINRTDNNLLGFGANYRLNDKYTVVFREYYDIEFNRNYNTEITLIRRWPRWYTAVTFDVDRPSDDIGITLSAWPEGAPRLGLGSKRYTGVADSIGLRP